MNYNADVFQSKSDNKQTKTYIFLLMKTTPSASRCDKQVRKKVLLLPQLVINRGLYKYRKALQLLLSAAPDVSKNK